MKDCWVVKFNGHIMGKLFLKFVSQGVNLF